MIRFGLRLGFTFSKIAQSLKVLQLTPPTTKKHIKAKYFELAKQLHPDVNEQEKSSSPKQKQPDDNQAFIQLTQAYKYLSDYSEEQINNPNSEESSEPYSKNSETDVPNSDEYFKPVTEEERIRKATYAYFNKKYKKQKNDTEDEQPKEPLYRQVPELFVGMFLVLLFIGEWAYTAFQRSRNSTRKPISEVNQQTFKGLNFKRRFQHGPSEQQFHVE